MLFFNEAPAKSTIAKKTWFTVTPQVQYCLNITVPTDEEIKRLITENGYTLIPEDALNACDLGVAGQGIMATKRIPMGSALPYGGQIQFHNESSRHSFIWNSKSIVVNPIREIGIIIFNFDLPEAELLKESLKLICNEIRQQYQKNHKIFPQAGLIWNNYNSTWYLVLAKQLNNAMIISINDLPELFSEFQKHDLLKIVPATYTEKMNTTLLACVKTFIFKFSDYPAHFCNGALDSIFLCINGENKDKYCYKNAAGLIQHTSATTMTSVVNTVNMRAIKLKREGTVTPKSIIVLVTTRDILPGAQLTYDYGAVKEFIKDNEMVLWDQSNTPLNPLFALPSHELLTLNETSNPKLIFHALLTTSADELWVVIKKTPVFFEYLLNVATSTDADLLMKNILANKNKMVETGNFLYAGYIKNRQNNNFKFPHFSLLTNVLDEAQCLAFFKSPHSAFNVLRNQELVKQIRSESRKLTCNWHRYFTIINYLEQETSSKYYKEKWVTTFRKEGFPCFNRSDFEKTIQHWQEALGYSQAEAHFKKYNTTIICPYNQIIYVTNQSVSTIWGLANAYKNLNLHEDALYFFNIAEYIVRDYPSYADAKCSLVNIQTRSEECRKALENLTVQSNLSRSSTP